MLKYKIFICDVWNRKDFPSVNEIEFKNELGIFALF